MCRAYKFIKGVFIHFLVPDAASKFQGGRDRPRSESLVMKSSSFLGFLLGDHLVEIEGLLVSLQLRGVTGSSQGRDRRGVECRRRAIEPWESGQREGLPSPGPLSGASRRPKGMALFNNVFVCTSHGAGLSLGIINIYF